MKKNLSDRERLILVALALAVVIAVVIWATIVFISDRYVHGMIQGHWLRFGMMTLFLSALLLRAYWNARNSSGFWIISLVNEVCLGTLKPFEIAAGNRRDRNVVEWLVKMARPRPSQKRVSTSGAEREEKSLPKELVTKKQHDLRDATNAMDQDMLHGYSTHRRALH
jgi:hypothetical protein